MKTISLIKKKLPTRACFHRESVKSYALVINTSDPDLEQFASKQFRPAASSIRPVRVRLRIEHAGFYCETRTNQRGFYWHELS
jgi:hypothetical protein